MYRAKAAGKDAFVVHSARGARRRGRLTAIRASQALAWPSSTASSSAVCMTPSAVTAEGQPSQLTGRV